MSAESTDYHPVKFLDGIEGNRHIVMLYDDDEKNADLIITRYLLNGYKRGQSCVFFTEEDTAAIERRLSAQGLDVAGYIRENRLRIFQIESSDSGKTDFLKTQDHPPGVHEGNEPAVSVCRQNDNRHRIGRGNDTRDGIGEERAGPF